MTSQSEWQLYPADATLGIHENSAAGAFSGVISWLWLTNTGSLHYFQPAFHEAFMLLNRHVLVLNRLWQAIHVCTARRAFTLLCQGHAQVVHTEDGSFSTHDFESWRDLSTREPDPNMVQTSRWRIRVPRVILLVLFDRMPRKEVKFTRHNIFERDRNTCQYCGKTFDRKDLNLDHVFPRDRGGPMTWENIVCSCIRCNTKKANRTPEQAKMHLIRKPERPKWRPFAHLTFGTDAHESWKHFVDFAYWNVELT